MSTEGFQKASPEGLAHFHNSNNAYEEYKTNVTTQGKTRQVLVCELSK